MGSLPVARIRLKRALSLHVTLPKKFEPAMLANAFEECQSGGRVCYSRRPFLPVLACFNRCWFGLFPKFSTPVEKTVEIREYCWAHVDSGPKFRGFLAGRR